MSDLYLAASRVLALVDAPQAMQDWEYAVDQLRTAVGAEKEPHKPVVTENEDGSTTTTFWDGTFQVTDADGTSTPRTTPVFERPESFPEEVASGAVLTTANVDAAADPKSKKK